MSDQTTVQEAADTVRSNAASTAVGSPFPCPRASEPDVGEIWADASLEHAFEASQIKRNLHHLRIDRLEETDPPFRRYLTSHIGLGAMLHQPYFGSILGNAMMNSRFNEKLMDKVALKVREIVGAELSSISIKPSDAVSCGPSDDTEQSEESRLYEYPEESSSYAFHIARFLEDDYAVPVFILKHYYICDTSGSPDLGGFRTKMKRTFKPLDVDSSHTSDTVRPGEGMGERTPPPTETVWLRNNDGVWSSPIEAHLDTGADANFMSKAYASELRLPFLDSGGAEVILPGGFRARIHGVVKTTIRWINEQQTTRQRWEFHVIEEDERKLIIGCDYIKAMKTSERPRTDAEVALASTVRQDGNTNCPKNIQDTGSKPAHGAFKHLYTIRIRKRPKDEARDPDVNEQQIEERRKRAEQRKKQRRATAREDERESGRGSRAQGENQRRQ